MNLPNHRFFHRDHLLSCRPFQLEDGRWQARVAIAAISGHKTLAQRFFDLEVFDDQVLAVAAAHEAGVAWVDKMLGLQPPRTQGADRGSA